MRNTETNAKIRLFPTIPDIQKVYWKVPRLRPLVLLIKAVLRRWGTDLRSNDIEGWKPVYSEKKSAPVPLCPSFTWIGTGSNPRLRRRSIIIKHLLKLNTIRRL